MAAVRKRTWTWKGETKEAWIVDYRDLGGKKRLKTFDTRKQAVNFSATTHIDLKNGIHIPDRTSVTVAQAGKLWLFTNEEGGLEPYSIKRNRQHLNSHIVPRIGAKRLNELNVPEIRAFITRLHSEGVSKALAKMIVTSLGSIIADAQERGLASHNPVREMRKNRRKRGQKANARGEKPFELGVEIPEAAEIRRILAKATGRRRALVAVLAFAGLRGSEMRGLRWSDIDLDDHTLSVRQRADQGCDIGEAKSAAGYRTVPLMPLVVNALKEWRLACPKSRFDLVFPNGNGNVESHQNIVQRHWHKLQLAVGVAVPALDKKGEPVVDKKGKPVLAPKYSGLHNLRHFFASWCIARQEAGGLGLDPKTVQIRCGHASIKQTLDTYGHLWPAKDDAELMAAAERAFLAG